VELSLLMSKAGNLLKAKTILAGLKTTAKRVTKSVPADKSVSAQIKSASNGFSLSLKARNAVKFGKFLTDNLGERFAKEESGS